ASLGASGVRVLGLDAWEQGRALACNHAAVIRAHRQSPLRSPNTGDQLQSPTQRRWRGDGERQRRALLQEFRRALSAASPRSATPPELARSPVPLLPTIFPMVPNVFQ